jgi:glycosyltransferase involved in cell wall biosynthesis
MPVKVVHVLGSAGTDATAHLRILGPLIAAEGGYGHTVCFLGNDGPLASAMQIAGADVEFIRWPGGRRDPVGAARFWLKLRRRSCDIVHQHFGGRSVRWASRRASGAGVILHLHGYVASESDTALPLAADARDTDAVIATSAATAALTQNRSATVVYPGLPPGMFESRVTPDRPTLTAAGRLEPVKGLIHLLHAAALLVNEFPDLLVEVAGDGSERDTLEGAALTFGIANNVRFLGWTDDLRPVLRRSSVFVQPSLQEAFGITVLEAMACGIPVIASAVGGLPEIVEDGRTGFLVPPGHAAALAEKIARLIRDPNENGRQGAASRARAATHFSAGQMVRSIHDVYDQVMRRAVASHGHIAAHDAPP